MKSDMEMVSVRLTKRLILEADELIREGWYANKSELIRDAVRILINKFKIEKLEEAINGDVKWGLYLK